MPERFSGSPPGAPLHRQKERSRSMKTITGTITEVKPYLAGQFSEKVDYSRANSSKAALITLNTGVSVDVILAEGASPEVGHTISTEIDDQGNFGFLYPDEIVED